MKHGPLPLEEVLDFEEVSGVYFPSQHGSATIKQVLPVLTEDSTARGG